MQEYDVLIIGTGPAGLSAAIYTSRADLKTLAIGKKQESQLWKAHAIENYFGVESLEGKKMLELGIKQAEKFNTTIKQDEIVNIKQEDNKFITKTSAGEEYKSRTIILATGMPIQLSGITNEEKFTGKGVHYCVVCDGFFYKDKKVAVIGAGNYAAEQALELLTYTKDITIISNGKEFEFAKKYKEAIEKNNIKLAKHKITAFEGDKKMEKLKTEKGEEINFDGAYMGIGCAGACDFAKKFGLELKGNTIITDKNGKTNIPGIYAAGTCTGAVSQVATTVGEGCAAGMSVIKQLKEKEIHVDYGKK